MNSSPINTIKEYRKKGYAISLHVDSSRPHYAVEMSDQHDVKRFTVPIKSISYKALLSAVRG